MAGKPVFHYGAGGALTCDRELEGITQELKEEDHAKWYGGVHFIGESMTKGAAKAIAEALGGVFEEIPGEDKPK